MRWWRWLLLLLVLGAAAYFLRGRFLGGSTGDAHRYQTAPVVKRHLREVVSASGTLNPLVSVTVGAEVNGVIRKVLVDYNSPVKSGQAVAQIDTLTYQAALTQAEGDLANAQAALKTGGGPTSSESRNYATQKMARCLRLRHRRGRRRGRRKPP